ncbi:MAG: hypothetical protein PWR07_2230 [Bacillota bacterium]|nr:hypothetical protein [Bacillota bacterium]
MRHQARPGARAKMWISNCAASLWRLSHIRALASISFIPQGSRPVKQGPQRLPERAFNAARMPVDITGPRREGRVIRRLCEREGGRPSQSSVTYRLFGSPLNSRQTYGIIPVGATRKSAYPAKYYAPVAQRIRASDYGSEGRGFESLQARQLFGGLDARH